MADRKRDLALFNLAIDSKLLGCDVVALRVDDVAPSGYASDRATIRQKKTDRPVRFVELTDQTRLAIDEYLSGPAGRRGKRGTRCRGQAASPLSRTDQVKAGRGRARWRRCRKRHLPRSERITLALSSCASVGVSAGERVSEIPRKAQEEAFRFRAGKTDQASCIPSFSADQAG